MDRWFGSPGVWRLVECAAAACGTLYLDPAPEPADLPLLYRHYYTHGVAGDAPGVLGSGLARRVRLAHLAHRFGYRPRDLGAARLLWPLLSLTPGRREHLELSIMKLRHAWRGRLLEVGCGSGAMLRLMRELGWDAEGIEPDPVAVASARAAGLSVTAGTLETAPPPAGAFTAVTASHVIEHVPEPRRFLEACRASLAPGGRLALTTPNARSLGHARFGSAWRGLEPPRHLQVFTAGSLARAVRDAGFADVRVESSARLAAMIVRESLRPSLAGTAVPGRAGPALRVHAGLFQALERAWLSLGNPAGEELFLMARRP